MEERGRKTRKKALFDDAGGCGINLTTKIELLE